MVTQETSSLPSFEHYRCKRMIEEQIRNRGVTDERVLEAMMSVPREAFVPPGQRDQVFEDRALPIGHNQTISQPFMVAYMTEQLRIMPNCKVLEIGTGTSYQTAILTKLCERVYTIERIPELVESAARTLTSLGITNVEMRIGDGTLGWPEKAPFDRIMITAGSPQIPPSLITQLADSGILIAPIGTWEEQRIIRVERQGQQITETALLGCRFVKLVGEEGWNE